MLGLYRSLLSLFVSYYTLANKDVTTVAPAYHCLWHDLSTFLRGASFQDLTPPL